MTDNNDEDMVIIKKYANRRLYDMSQSQYVTLDDLCEMVKKGINFKVIDAKSEDDLTRSVLAQIIFEQESKGVNILPVSFLRQIISFYDDNLSSVLNKYLENSMHNFCQKQDEMRKYVDDINQFSPIKQFEEISKQNMQWFEKTMDMMSPFSFTNNSNDEKDDADDGKNKKK